MSQEIEPNPDPISQEVQEIIGRRPSGIVRWGMVVITGAFVSLLGISWFIEYPDLLPATVIITTSTPPYNLVSRTNGNLVLLKNDNESVNEGELIAFIRSNSNPETVLDLEASILKSDTTFNSLKSLGDLEEEYGATVNALLELKLFEEEGIYDEQIKQLQKQEHSYRKLHDALNLQKELGQQELSLASEKFKIDSLLFSQRVSPIVDFNKDRATWLQQQRAFSNTETALLNNEIQLNQLSKQISDIKIEKEKTRQKLNLEAKNRKNALLAKIARWKETYMFISPIRGEVAYIGFKENDMYVEAGKRSFSVLPMKDSLIARAELPLYNSGKVRIGQRVNIKLDNYPFEQYGTVQGTISSISSVPSEEKYYVSIALPEKLNTSQHRSLEFHQQLSGSTEIITEDLRLLERFIYQFRKLLSHRSTGSE